VARSLELDREIDKMEKMQKTALNRVEKVGGLFQQIREELLLSSTDFQVAPCVGPALRLRQDLS